PTAPVVGGRRRPPAAGGPTSRGRRPVPTVRLRPPRDPRPLPGVRGRAAAGGGRERGGMRRVRRIVGKTVRLAVAGVLLLSLLASVGTGWLWWRSGRGAWSDRLEVKAGGAFLAVESSDGRADVLAVWRWPGR